MVVALLVACAAFAFPAALPDARGEPNLAWDYPASAIEEFQVVGFRLYCVPEETGTGGSVAQAPVVVDVPLADLKEFSEQDRGATLDLPAGVHWNIDVRAYTNANVESEPSNVVAWAQAPPATNLRKVSYRIDLSIAEDGEVVLLAMREL